MSKKTKIIDPAVASIDNRISLITRLLPKMSQDNAERWDRRRNNLHEARKILTKHQRV